MKFNLLKSAVAVALCCVLGSASAGVVISPGSVSGNGGTFPASHIIDQSGLSAHYVSGVTDFDSFVASTTSNYGLLPNLGELGDTAGPTTGRWIFNLGSVHLIDEVAIWNQAGSASLDSFRLVASTVSDFSISSVLGTYTMSQFGGCYPCNADVFSFAETSAQYIRLDVLSNAGYSGATRINEIAFEQVNSRLSVPEPATPALLGLALGWLAISRRKFAAKK